MAGRGTPGTSTPRSSRRPASTRAVPSSAARTGSWRRPRSCCSRPGSSPRRPAPSASGQAGNRCPLRAACGTVPVVVQGGSVGRSGGLTRRQLIRAGVAGGAAVGAYGLASDTIARALADAPSCGRLEDIEHVVILVQENRSFDHYFGTYRGVLGFKDPGAIPLNGGNGLTVFAQP